MENNEVNELPEGTKPVTVSDKPAPSSSSPSNDPVFNDLDIIKRAVDLLATKISEARLDENLGKISLSYEELEFIHKICGTALVRTDQLNRLVLAINQSYQNCSSKLEELKNSLVRVERP